MIFYDITQFVNLHMSGTSLFDEQLIENASEYKNHIVNIEFLPVQNFEGKEDLC